MDTLILAARVVVSLVAVFGLMWLVQRKLRTGGTATRAKALSVIARQSVGQKASVVLVDTDGKRFMLGVTEHGISVLHTGDVPEPEPVVARAPAPTAPTSVVDPTVDRLVGEDLEDVEDDEDTLAPAAEPAPALPTRAVPQASFEAELAHQRAGLGAGAAGAAPRGAGSILEPATWRLAAEAIRSGRRS